MVETYPSRIDIDAAADAATATRELGNSSYMVTSSKSHCKDNYVIYDTAHISDDFGTIADNNPN